MQRNRNNIFQDLIGIVETVKAKITDESDLLWTSYDIAKELRDELDTYIEQLKQEDKTCLKMLNIHFAPTSTFQEHSLMNGWTKEYMKVSKKFDSIYAKMK